MRNPTSAGDTGIALTAVAAMLGIMFVGAILPTPLYPLYREAFGFSGVTLTLIYATYVLGQSHRASVLRPPRRPDRTAAGELAGCRGRHCQRRYFYGGARHRLAVRGARRQRFFHRSCFRRGHRLDCRTLRRER